MQEQGAEQELKVQVAQRLRSALQRVERWVANHPFWAAGVYLLMWVAVFFLGQVTSIPSFVGATFLILLTIFVLTAWAAVNLFSGTAAFLLIVAVVLLIVWAFTNVVWTADSERRQSEVLFERDDGVLEVEVPALVLADAAPQDVRFVWRPQPAWDEPLTFTMTVPTGLAVAGRPHLREIPITFSPSPLRTRTRPLTAELQITSARTLATFLHSEQQLGFAYSRAMSGTVESLPVNVEGEKGFVFRRFINSAVNRESPLILLAIALISAAGSIFHINVREQRAERRARRRQLALRRRTSLLRESEGLLEELEKQLIIGNVKAASRAYAKLEEIERQLHAIVLADDDPET